MNTARNLPNHFGYALVKAKWVALHVKKSVQLAFPGVFGLPIKDALVQLYRSDSQYETSVSFINYLSYFLPDKEIAIRYSVDVYDRHGGHVAAHTRVVGARQTLQMPLTEFVGSDIDEYGLFRVNVSYQPGYAPEARFLGQTAPQFMTLFIPRDRQSGPQAIHSHKHYEYLPVWKTPNLRRSAVVEELDRMRRLDIFVLNSSPTKVRGGLELRSIADDSIWSSQKFEIAGHGVRKVSYEIAAGEASAPTAVSYVLELDKAIQHRKPIIFRTFQDGVVTCNHS